MVTHVQKRTKAGNGEREEQRKSPVINSIHPLALGRRRREQKFGHLGTLKEEERKQYLGLGGCASPLRRGIFLNTALSKGIAGAINGTGQRGGVNPEARSCGGSRTLRNGVKRGMETGKAN